MDEARKIRSEKLQVLLDKVERLKRLQDNPDYQLFLECLHKEQDQFLRVLTRPRIIGSIKEVKKTDKAVELLKYTTEDDREAMKEAQLRYDTLRKILNIIPDLIKDAERYKSELKEITA
jgi:hypothetical protein